MPAAFLQCVQIMKCLVMVDIPSQNQTWLAGKWTIYRQNPLETLETSISKGISNCYVWLQDVKCSCFFFYIASLGPEGLIRPTCSGFFCGTSCCPTAATWMGMGVWKPLLLNFFRRSFRIGTSWGGHWNHWKERTLKEPRLKKWEPNFFEPNQQNSFSNFRNHDEHWLKFSPLKSSQGTLLAVAPWRWGRAAHHLLLCWFRKLLATRQPSLCHHCPRLDPSFFDQKRSSWRCQIPHPQGRIIYLNIQSTCSHMLTTCSHQFCKQSCWQLLLRCCKSFWSG